MLTWGHKCIRFLLSGVYQYMVSRDELRLQQRSSGKGLLSNYYRSWCRQEVLLPAPPQHILLYKGFLAAKIFGKILIMWLFQLFGILLPP